MVDRKLTDEELRGGVGGWEFDTEDDLHRHFNACGIENPVVVGQEGLRIWNLMFDADAEVDSPIDHAIYAIAAAGHHGAVRTLARMTGVDEEALLYLIDEWSADPKAKAINMSDLSDEIAAMKRILSAVNAGSHDYDEKLKSFP